ncbi:MAG TPA: FtsX-like permease family protein [Elusimicrobiota bacterium]|jgi:putative ABC transport system permease protein|nr:FtsX-like permease family protein [Elusimicrobiota bacterium]HMX43159.1 FtsX-like permease family protein [Elusimicrobiota bacterium]HMZ25923.1 FtsX-like permease family protein [Elusimicrobiota bacterium]HNA60921.1 FtsX-like permease family protein [Elusimicrobiota bacterium]HND63485.1 FtsX-like permease family protein [Elusimicrobiota bacterium]
MFYWTLPLRNIFRRPGRTLVTLAAIAFGSVALIFAGGFIDDSLVQLRESYIRSQFGHLQIFQKGYLRYGAARPFAYLLKNHNRVMDVVLAHPDVDIVTPRIEFAGLISRGETSVSFVGQGVNPRGESKMNTMFRIEAGKNLQAKDKFQVVMGRGLAASLSAKPGDTAVIVANTVRGSVNALDVTVKGIFSTSAKAFDDHVLRVPFSTAAKLLYTGEVQSLIVLLKDTSKTRSVRRDLEKLFKSRGYATEIQSWEDLADVYNNSRDFLNRQMGILRWIILIVSVLSVVNTANMAVLERVGEIGTMRAMGTSRWKVMAVFIMEGLLLGLMGGALGALAGVGVARWVSHFGIPMPPPPGSTMEWVAHIRLVPRVFAQAFAIAVGSSFFSILYPSWKASRLEVAEALRHQV